MKSEAEQITDSISRERRGYAYFALGLSILAVVLMIVGSYFSWRLGL